MSTNDCNCATGVLDRGAIERPRFFPRQLVTPDDLTLGQEYFRTRFAVWFAIFTAGARSAAPRWFPSGARSSHGRL